MDEIDLPSNPRIKTKTRIIEKAADDFGRKRWEVDHYEELEQALEEPSIDSRTEKYLLARTKKLQLEKKHSKDGFFCQVCNQLYKCDIAYLTHINSEAHNRKIGMSLKVEASSVEDVKNKLGFLERMKLPSKTKQKLNDKKSRMDAIVNKQLQAAIKNNNFQDSKQISSEQEVDNNSEESKIPPQEVSQKQNQNKFLEEKNATQANVEAVQTNAQIKGKGLQRIEQPQQEPQQDPDEVLMRAMGLPTSFKSKNKKR